MTLLRNAWLIPAIPAASFAVILLFGKRLPRQGSEVGILSLLVSWLLATGCAIQWIRLPVDHESHLREPVERGFTWFHNGMVQIGAGIHIDGLTVMMLFVVTFISLLVHIYSSAYMKDDRRFTHFYAALSLFTASMLLLVVADNLLLLLVGWELVGLCSFMLIGHWWEEKDNSNAALKAFFTTRTGDAGFMIGIIILFFAADTFNIAAINHAALEGHIGHTMLLVGAITLFMGPIGKSAQFPLHTWLPDAMAGPTPVSALIHAATMVVAGVYVVARCYGVFWAAFNIGDGGINLIAIIGGITILIAAMLAFVQDDIKKVLAYSTVSQLGYMIMGLGVGAWTGAIFHLFTHAFFKANLFLGAGSVSHSGSHHSFDMKKDMGGLKKHMPTTYRTFLIGSIALAGLPPLAGFWSKDEILNAAGKNGFTVFMWVGLIGAVMTAAYMTRCVYLTFFGEYRGHGHPHESPPAITGPLVVLSFFSIVAGFLAVGQRFGGWTLNEAIEHAHVPEYGFNVTAATMGTVAGLVGILLAGAYYFRNLGPRGLTDRSGLARGGYQLLANRYYLDHLYTGVIVGGIKGPLARAAYWFNQNVLDGVVHGAAAGARGAAAFTYDVIDQKVVDGLVNGAGVSAEEGGGWLRTIQTGRVQQYAAVLFAATAMFAIALIVWA
ncbi:MAG TPA: NADH-quinone oxidoreductase subunit L [Acidimicrobiales bacterium]|nr:NADH-quinone oxidoreductase subunit L [Acidimicrobiales bacterium]